MKVQTHDHLEAVGPVAWDALVDASRLRSPFVTWMWQCEWVRAFAPDARLEVRTVEDEAGRLVAILPLVEVEPGVLRGAGGTDVSDYLDLIVRAGLEEEAWAALLEARAGERVAWDLHAVPAASPTAVALPRLARTCGLTATVQVEERCPVLALPASWEAYLAGLSGKHRHELGRKLRRLERERPEARATCLEGAAAVEARLGASRARRGRSRVGKARFMDARMEGFFRRTVVALAARGGARLWVLDTAAGSIAAFITLEWDGTVGLYNSGFHPDHAQLSPGVVLLSHLVRDAITRGRHRFDFLRGEERYKYEFEPVPEDVCHVRITPADPPPASP